MKSIGLILTLVVLAAGAYASGGAYLDDFRITNNGVTALFDNFDDGKLDGWTQLNDITVTCNRPNEPPCGMCINKHTYAEATASHNLALRNAGIIEFQAKVYLTAPEEQYDWQVKKLPAVIRITIFAGTTSATMRTTLYLEPGQQQAKACISTDRVGNGQCPKYNPLAKYRWGTWYLRMDPKTRTATTSLDGREEISISYNPNLWRSVRMVSIESSYGDGSRRTD